MITIYKVEKCSIESFFDRRARGRVIAQEKVCDFERTDIEFLSARPSHPSVSTHTDNGKRERETSARCL